MAVVQAQFLAPQENALASAFGKALGTVAEGAAKGAEARRQAGAQSNATTFNAITNRLDAYWQKYGSPGFQLRGDETGEELAMKQAAIRDLDVWGQAYEGVSGGRVRPEQLEAMKNAFRNGGSTAANLDALQNIRTGYAVSGARQDSPPPAPPVDKVTPGSTAATQAAEAAQRSQAQAAAQKQAELSAFGERVRGFGQTSSFADAVRAGNGMLMGFLPNKSLEGLWAKYPELKGQIDAKIKSKGMRPTQMEYSTAIGDVLAEWASVDPIFAGELKPILSGLQSPLNQPGMATTGVQTGQKANGTVSLEAHERRTGDEHYPARVGVEEGIVNAVAMKQPGVAEMIMELNRRFPANVAASRGTYADGYVPQEDLVLDEGGEPSVRPTTGEAYMGAVQALNSAAQDTASMAAQAPQAQAPVYEPTPRTPGDPLSQRDAQLAQENADRLVSRAKAKIAELSGPAPRHTNKYLAAMDEIAQHARDVQAKYQINWANPDPRERAILQRELAWEQAKTKAAMAADRPRQEWQKMALDNIKNFMRNASDEEIASAFGPEVATARNNRKTRDLGWAQVEVEAKKALNEGEAVDTFSRTLAAEVMTKAFTPIMEKFVVDGKFNDEQFSKALSSTPLLKNAADIVSMYMLQAPVAGTANLQQTRSWFPLDRKIYFGFDYSGTGGATSPSTAGAPQFSSDAESLMRKME